MIWGTVLGGVVDLAKGWVQGKAEEQKVKQEVKLEKLKTDADWEARMADATANSWKDEYLIILLTLPLWFIGYGVIMNDTAIIDRVHAGFTALQQLPEFYQYLLYTGVLASFGIKGADTLMKMRK
jgi:hypothetical protein